VTSSIIRQAIFENFLTGDHHGSKTTFIPGWVFMGFGNRRHQVEGGNTNNNWYVWETHTPARSPALPSPAGV
jgi:hypothetical protein